MTIAFGYFTKSEVLLSIWVFHLLAILQVGIFNRTSDHEQSGSHDAQLSAHYDVGSHDAFLSEHEQSGSHDAQQSEQSK